MLYGNVVRQLFGRNLFGDFVCGVVWDRLFVLFGTGTNYVVWDRHKLGGLFGMGLFGTGTNCVVWWGCLGQAQIQTLFGRCLGVVWAWKLFGTGTNYIYNTHKLFNLDL